MIFFEERQKQEAFLIIATVDFFVTYEDNRVVFNEINTIPGFTSISMYPKLFAASGIPYDALLDRLLELALEAFA